MQPNQPDPNLDQTPAPTTPGPDPQPQPAPQYQPQQPAPTFNPPVEPSAPVAPAPQEYAAAPAPAPEPTPTPSPFDAPTPQANYFGSATPVQPTPDTTAPAADPGFAPVATPPPAPKKSKKGLIIALIIVGAVLLIGGAVFAATQLLGGTVKDALVENVSNGADTAATTDPAKKEAITADGIIGFMEVCNGKKISNAAEPTKPYKGVGFLKYNETWAATGTYGYVAEDAASFSAETSSFVACLIPDESTAATPVTCEDIEDYSTKEKFSVTASTITYDITMYEAKTGEKIGEDTITSVVDCPKIGIKETAGDIKYFNPNVVTLKTLIDEFIAQ